jgi:hypothetical protein
MPCALPSISLSSILSCRTHGLSVLISGPAPCGWMGFSCRSCWRCSAADGATLPGGSAPSSRISSRASSSSNSRISSSGKEVGEEEEVQEQEEVGEEEQEVEC